MRKQGFRFLETALLFAKQTLYAEGMTATESATSPTVRDVARHAGVSVGTVSRTLNNQPGIAQATRERVLHAVHQLGYDLANLRQGRLRRLSFLYHRQHNALTSNLFYSHVLHGVEEACRLEKINLSFSSLGPDDALAELIGRQEAEGLVCVGFFEPQQLAAIAQLRVPAVLVDHWRPNFACVNSDNFGGAYLATEHLIRQGRGRVAFIGGPLTHYSIAQRQQGYRHALLSNGLPLDPNLELPRDPIHSEDEGTESAVRRLLALSPRPDAVFAFNDATALRAMRALQLAGLRVPQDIAVVGFDDVDAAASALPPLSTVRVDKEELGRRGVELLLSRQTEPNQVIVPVTFVPRASSGAR